MCVVAEVRRLGHSASLFLCRKEGRVKSSLAETCHVFLCMCSNCRINSLTLRNSYFTYLFFNNIEF